MLLKHLIENQNLREDDATQDVIDIIGKIKNPSVISKANDIIQNLLNKVKPQNPNKPQQSQTNDPDQQPVEEDIQSEKDEIINAVMELAKSGNQEAMWKYYNIVKEPYITQLSTDAISANIAQGVLGGMDKRLAQTVMNVNASFEDKEAFLLRMASKDGFWDGNELITTTSGNIYEKFNDPILKAIQYDLAVGNSFTGALGYGPNQGPGEFLLALTGKGIGLAEKSDLIVNGTGVEVKADNGRKKSRSGGRMIATAGYGNAVTAKMAMYKTMIELGVPNDLLAKFNWPKKIKGVVPPRGGLNYNPSGIANFNEYIAPYLKEEGTKKVLASMVGGLYTEMPDDMASNFINAVGADGTINAAQSIIELTVMAYAYYQKQEGHDCIMVFNTKNGDFVIINSGDEVRELMTPYGKAELNVTSLLDFHDSRSNGSPQLLTR